MGGYSVLNLLVVLAGLSLLITRTYPRPLFNYLFAINPLALPSSHLRGPDARRLPTLPARPWTYRVAEHAPTCNFDQPIMNRT